MTSTAAATDYPETRRARARPPRVDETAGTAASARDSRLRCDVHARPDVPFSLRDALQWLFKHGWLVGGCTVLVTALVWLGVALQPRVYEGAGKLWIKTEPQTVPSFLSGIATYRDQAMPDPLSRRIETEKELLLSRDSAERVVEQLGVRPEQLRQASLEVVADRLARVRIALQHLFGRQDVSPVADAGARRRELVDAFLQSFSVEPQRSKDSGTRSDILEIRFSATDPALVPTAINAMVQAYIRLAAQQNHHLGEATFRLLETKVLEAQRDLAQSSLPERQRALAQERLVELQRRLDQIDVYLKANLAEAQSRVMTQSPERPLRPETGQLWLVALLGPFGGLLLGLAFAGTREMLDRRLQTPEELRRALGVAVLAALPELPQRALPARQYAACLAGARRRLGRAGQRGSDSTAPMDFASDHGMTLPPLECLPHRVPVVNGHIANDRSLSMHRLALRVSEQLPPAAMGRVLVVTSARPGEGKSVIARALAKRLALQGRGDVLLVDASPDAPAGHGGDRARGRPGFFDILRDAEVMAEVVASRDTPRLQSLGVGFDPEASLLYHDAAVAELMAKVRERYDWTVIDAGCLQHIGSLGANSDAVLLVVDAQSTRREVIQGTLDAARLPAHHVLGAVLNRRPQHVPGWLYRGLL